MAAKVNVKNMDYFKFKKIVIDGSRDDYESCSREIRSLCDAVQTLSFRDEQFADNVDESSESSSSPCSGSDRQHFDEIVAGYRLILTGKRVDPVDIRVKTGWWADSVGSATSSCGSAGKFKSSALRETLLRKTADWSSRHCRSGVSASDELDRHGVFVFKHRDRQCFQYVGRSSGQRGGVFAACSDLLKSTFDGTLAEPIAALLVVSMAADWDFYYLPLAEHDNDRMSRIVVNDVIICHDALWPRGLNELLYVQTPLEVAELRRSCLRHRWPLADADLQTIDAQLDLAKLRARLQQQQVVVDQSLPSVTSWTANGTASSASKKGGTEATRTPSTCASTAKSTQQQHSIKSNLSSPTNRRPTTTNKSNTAASPTKTPRSRPQSAPKPPSSASTSSRPPQPSAGTPNSRPKSAKSTMGGGDGCRSKPGRSTAGRVAAASAETTESASMSHTSSANEPANTSTSKSTDLVTSMLHDEPCNCPTTLSRQQVPATV